MSMFLTVTNSLHARRLGGPALTAAVFVFAMISVAGAQQHFKTPEEAAEALVIAAKTGEQALLTVFGPDSADIVSSGDPVNDEVQRKKFVAAYDAGHQVERQDDGKATLFVGAKDWPVPVPLVKKSGGWTFDAAAGRQEILFRRVGRDELETIQSCLAYVDAQNDYAQLMRASTGVATYAQRIVSEPGKKDGLYWPTQPEEEPSPLGEQVADASAQGYKITGERAPYHGYYYKILKRQGPAAHGGAYDYVARGKMIGGFALVAYPAIYRNSGVMTFLVNHEGTVFEKDLGPDTGKLAEAITSFNPDGTWKKVTGEPPAE